MVVLVARPTIPTDGSCRRLSTKDGPLIIGYSFTVLSAVLLVYSFVFLIPLVLDLSTGIGDHEQNKLNILHAFKFALTCLLCLIGNALLVHGINYKKPGYVLMWIIGSMAAVVILSLSRPHLLDPSEMSFTSAIVATIVIVVLQVLKLCAVFIVTKHYLQMNKGEKEDERALV